MSDNDRVIVALVVLMILTLGIFFELDRTHQEAVRIRQALERAWPSRADRHEGEAVIIPTRQIFCLACGSPRTLGTFIVAREPGLMTCFKCGGETFTSNQAEAVQFPSWWYPTVRDKRFLKSLRIAA